MNYLFGMSRAAKRPRCQDNDDCNISNSRNLPTEVWSKVLQCKNKILFCGLLIKCII